jgi:hypothetical protein
MIIIVPLSGEPIEHFENYNELFEHLTAIENTKLIAKNPYFKEMNWSFTIHPPRRVAAFYTHLKDSCDAIKEAYEEGLSLIVMCTGDYRTPTYIALTPNVNVDYLKKKWCVDYCTWHHLLVTEA